ncbi:MAG: hypothetical protein CL779_01980 [Chloroflexi bacterium]|nr:hypothetical protein [Chloroflexota bacterium]|tara:strand:- start:4086 stop:5054 length:969 start_codon:yes stop_codon:yes gene_type:complete
MSKQSLLALGIPTYKRPDAAIKVIEQALELNIFDQIIISSNSQEEKIKNFVEKKETSVITFFEQNENVGISRNYKMLIDLCNCKYLHVISDEDYLIKERLKELYSFLEKRNGYSLIVMSVNDSDGQIYKDASWQRNKYLYDALGETAHIGSTVINTKIWTNQAHDFMIDYCSRSKGDVYPTTAAALISYSIDTSLYYFPHAIVQMGEKDDFSEMRGKRVYATNPKLEQFISVLMLVRQLQIPRKIMVYMYIFYYFSHHALQQAHKRFDEKPLPVIKSFIKENQSGLKDQISLYLLVIWYYYFLNYYHVKSKLGSKLREYNLR